MNHIQHTLGRGLPILCIPHFYFITITEAFLTSKPFLRFFILISDLPRSLGASSIMSKMQAVFIYNLSLLTKRQVQKGYTPLRTWLNFRLNWSTSQLIFPPSSLPTGDVLGYDDTFWLVICPNSITIGAQRFCASVLFSSKILKLNYKWLLRNNLNNPYKLREISKAREHSEGNSVRKQRSRREEDNISFDLSFCKVGWRKDTATAAIVCTSSHSIRQIFWTFSWWRSIIFLLDFNKVQPIHIISFGYKLWSDQLLCGGEE